MKSLIAAMVMLFSIQAMGQNGSNSHQDPFEIYKRAYQLAIKNYDLQAATVMLYRMVALRPDRDDLNDSLALIYFAGERYTQSYLIGEEILKKKPSRYDMLEVVAVSKHNLGLESEALADYEKLYKHDKGTNWLYQIASIQYQLHRYNECIHNVDQILYDREIDNKTVSITLTDSTKYDIAMKAAAYNLKGVCYKEINALEQARVNFQNALKVDPDFILAKNNLDELHSTGNKIKDEYPDAVFVNESAKPQVNTRLPETLAGRSEKFIPPVIVIEKSSVVFKDEGGNNALNAFENSTIAFDIKNTGDGVGKNLSVQLNARGKTNGLFFSSITSIQSLDPSKKTSVSIPITASENIEDGTVIFTLLVKEPNGFGSDPVEIEVSTLALLPPLVKVVDYSITGITGSTLVRKQPFDLQILLQNVKNGNAEDVIVTLGLPQHVLCLSGNENTRINGLTAGETKDVVYTLIVSDNYTQESIPIHLHLSEKLNRYAEDKEFSVNINQTLSTSKITLTPKADFNANKAIVVASLSSDVDKNIPLSPNKKTNAYALIIGNEDYTRYQSGLSNEANVEFARNDANIFAQYAERTLGIPIDNIVLLTDAISSKMRSEIERVVKMAQLTKGEIYFYYAGHGLPDAITKQAYIMPVDISGNEIQSAIPLNELYNRLCSPGVTKATVFLDACFSGGGRSEGLIAARAVKVAPKADILPPNIIVFAASTGTQMSLPFKEKQHGMFTYYLLKKLQDTKGDVTLKVLSEYVIQNVGLQSLKINSREQNPAMSTGGSLISNWDKLSLSK